MKQLLLTDWHVTRWLRLGLGIFMGASAIQTHDAFVGLLATFLLWQAVTNTGCCGASGCTVRESKGNPSQTSEVRFEEVKTK